MGLREDRNYLKERKVTHEQLTNIVKDKYVVFYHSSDNFVFGIHKFIIRLKKCYPGSNGAMGAVRFKFDIIKDDYVFPLCHNDDEFKKNIKNFGECVCYDSLDGRNLFHYRTDYFSPKYFQKSKIFKTLEEAEKYYMSLNNFHKI